MVEVVPLWFSAKVGYVSIVIDLMSLIVHDFPDYRASNIDIYRL